MQKKWQRNVVEINAGQSFIKLGMFIMCLKPLSLILITPCKSYPLSFDRTDIVLRLHLRDSFPDSDCV